MFRHLRSLLARHWHGQVALVPTLVFTLLGLRLAISWVSRLRPPDWPLTLFALATGLSLAVLLWQVAGSLRAMHRDGSGLGLAAGSAAAAVAVLLFLLAELDGYASRAADSGGLPPVVPLPVHGTELAVEGPLDWPLYARFCSSLKRFPEIDTVTLRSDGGFVPVARAMAQRIAEAGLDTRAEGLCASACTLAFMAGENRSLGPEGALGFHGYALLSYYNPIYDTGAEQERDRAWLLARGIDPAFLDRAFSTAHSSLWRPDAATLWAAGILTEGNSGAPAPWSAPDCGFDPDQAASP